MDATFKTTDIDKRDQYANFDWDQLGFSLIQTDYMYVMKYSKEKNSFSYGNLFPYQNIELNPAASILNYGQGLIEGLKAYRREDGQIQLFRPDENAIRMQIGADRLCMPSPSVDQFIFAVKQTVLANKHWVPPPGKGTLYIRPLLIGSGPVLGMSPASEYTFLVYVSPVANFHKTPLNLIVKNKLHRATPGGTGCIKAITNYSPVMKPLAEERAKGFSDILFVDAATGNYIEELSGCNIFIVKGKVLSTPTLNGTILPGITRRSIIELALDFGYQVEERMIAVEELFDVDEVFCTGTAVGVTLVGSLTYEDKRVEYKTGAHTVSQKLNATLTRIQTGHVDDKMGWTVKIY